MERCEDVKNKPPRAVNSVIDAPLPYSYDLSIIEGVLPHILAIAKMPAFFQKDDCIFVLVITDVCHHCAVYQNCWTNMYRRTWFFKRTRYTLTVFKHQCSFQQGYSTYLALTALFENWDYVAGSFFAPGLNYLRPFLYNVDEDMTHTVKPVV